MRRLKGYGSFRKLNLLITPGQLAFHKLNLFIPFDFSNGTEGSFRLTPRAI
jgi:hypothetical protein